MVVHCVRAGQGRHWLLANRATIRGAAVGEDAGQGLAVVGGGRGGGHVRDHVDAVRSHVSVTCAANPFQRMMCPWRTWRAVVS